MLNLKKMSWNYINTDVGFSNLKYFFSKMHLLFSAFFHVSYFIYFIFFIIKIGRRKKKKVEFLELAEFCNFYGASY